MQWAVATVTIHLLRFTQRSYHAPCVCEPQTNCLLFSRGHRLVGLQSTQWSPVFTQQLSTSLGATCLRCHAPSARPPHLFHVRCVQQHTHLSSQILPAFTLPEVPIWLQPVCEDKNKPKIEHHVIGTSDSCCFFFGFFFLQQLSFPPQGWHDGSSQPASQPARPVCGEDLCLIPGYQNGIM